MLLRAFDGHDVRAVEAALAAGADARSSVNGKEPIRWLLEEYTRSDDLQRCVRLLLDAGADLEPGLAAVLLNEPEEVRAVVKEDPSLLDRRLTLRSSFTSMTGVTLLHVAAEYGNFASARVFIEEGADVNARSGVNDLGVGGHTPIFHTVNSNRNRSAPIMNMLVEAGALADIRVNCIVWGEGYPWETYFFDVSPIAYAQCGLLPQMHRSESDIYSNISFLVDAAGRQMPILTNIPNRYLQPKG